MAADRMLDALVIGAGWAGLAVSRALQLRNLRHLVLERGEVAHTWRTQRWDAFHMNTPNVHTVMPGDRYEGDAPEGFMTRDEFVHMVCGYAARHALPVQTNTAVTNVRPHGDDGFEVTTPQGALRARHVVVATGNLNVPLRPAAAAKLPARITQIDGSDYRRADRLPPGAVLVVGCGNSGGQIAEDLALSGRKVFLAAGRNGRVPRRYRGRDVSLWLAQTGRYDRPRTSRTGRPLLGATHTISLQLLSTMGVVLLGRLLDVEDGGAAVFSEDLADSARFGDQVSAELKAEIDAFVARTGLAAPPPVPDEAETVAARFPQPPIRSLDLGTAGVSTVIWSVGFRGDFGWLEVPGALDGQGQPVQTRCASVPGIHFAGLDTPASLKAGTILVAAEESAWIADRIASG